MSDPLKATLEQTKVPMRVFLLNIIQLLGIIALALNHPDAAPILALFPAAVATKLAAIGLTLIALKPAFNILSDWADNGIVDDSYRAAVAMFIPAGFAASCFMYSSCASIPFTGSIDTPWGSGSKDGMGNVTIKPWPQQAPPVATPVVPPQANNGKTVKMYVSSSGQVFEQHPWWDLGHATGFTRPVPTDVAAKGIAAKLRYLVLEVPNYWDPIFNPLLEPGEDPGLPTVDQLHRKNIRLITENPGYGLWEELQEQ